MGSGKSTTGRRLASLLGWSFTDLDEMVENLEGMKIPDIFSEKGEDYFRLKEKEALHLLTDRVRTVISTGGGTPCCFDNMDFMILNGLTIYLQMTPEQLSKRLSGSKGKRPLIKNIEKSQLLEFIETRLAERRKWYHRAEITVDGNNTNIPVLVSLLRGMISE
jgi:shikimate kinase